MLSGNRNYIAVAAISFSICQYTLASQSFISPAQTDGTTTSWSSAISSGLKQFKQNFAQNVLVKKINAQSPIIQKAIWSVSGAVGLAGSIWGAYRLANAARDWYDPQGAAERAVRSCDPGRLLKAATRLKENLHIQQLWDTATTDDQKLFLKQRLLFGLSLTIIDRTDEWKCSIMSRDMPSRFWTPVDRKLSDQVKEWHSDAVTSQTYFRTFLGSPIFAEIRKQILECKKDIGLLRALLLRVNGDRLLCVKEKSYLALQALLKYNFLNGNEAQAWLAAHGEELVSAMFPFPLNTSDAYSGRAHLLQAILTDYEDCRRFPLTYAKFLISSCPDILYFNDDPQNADNMQLLCIRAASNFQFFEKMIYETLSRKEDKERMLICLWEHTYRYPDSKNIADIKKFVCNAYNTLGQFESYLLLRAYRTITRRPRENNTQAAASSSSNTTDITFTQHMLELLRSLDESCIATLKTDLHAFFALGAEFISKPNDVERNFLHEIYNQLQQPAGSLAQEPQSFVVAQQDNTATQFESGTSLYAIEQEMKICGKDPDLLENFLKSLSVGDRKLKLRTRARIAQEVIFREDHASSNEATTWIMQNGLRLCLTFLQESELSSLEATRMLRMMLKKTSQKFLVIYTSFLFQHGADLAIPFKNAPSTFALLLNHIKDRKDLEEVVHIFFTCIPKNLEHRFLYALHTATQGKTDDVMNKLNNLAATIARERNIRAWYHLPE